MEIVTAHKGKAHVTAEKMAELNRGVVGSESYVMEGGRQFECELASNNLLKIYDGSGMMQGRHVCIPVGQSDELTIENGNQGMKRIDLVVVRYTKDENTKIENTETIVIKGTPSESAPVVPEHIEGDIRLGDMTVDWPLYEVELDGISVVEVRPVFKAILCMDTMSKDLKDIRITESGVGYVKYADGRMEAWGNTELSAVKITSHTGLLYNSAAQTIVFPQKFLTKPVVNIDFANAGGAFASLGGVNEIQFNFYIYADKEQSRSGTACWRAIGRWK